MLEIPIRICFICNLWVSDFGFWLFKSPKDGRVQRSILGSAARVQDFRDTKENIEPVGSIVIEICVIEYEISVFGAGYGFFLVFI